ncbi:MAG: hypothetical protein OEV27_07390 [Nitrospira sp.]|nr:hypothetical protein [Nitrospira sp.]MDH4250996.1 hypothetical protein [Nitrospira sp.]MDH4343185.1 hypothetical protein [Nitrospira sp.]MDH5334758.1 hypothetical protein [Nitrospira sp.]
MADPTYGDARFDCCVGITGDWLSEKAEACSIGKDKSTRLTAMIRRTSQVDGDRIEGTVPSEEYQKRMGGL